MKSTKRLLALLMVMTLLLSYLSPAAAAAAPADTADPTATESVTLTVWAAQTDQEWLIQQTEAFEAAHPEWNIVWEMGVVNAGDAYSIVGAYPESSADVYMFTSDQTSSLLDAGALLALSGDALAQVTATNGETVVNTLRGPDTAVYGVPMSGNTWFMYYNKNIFSEEDVTSLEAMLEKGKVAYPVSNGWYMAAFYFATGCTMFGEYGVDAAAGIQFGGENGTAATKHLVELMDNPNFVNDADGLGNSGLKDGSIGAYFSGSWDYAGLYNALGDDLGAAQLPTITIDGAAKQLRSFAGSTAIGVNPHSDNTEAAMAFAAFLGTADSQKARYEATGAIPTCASLAEDPDIASNVSAAAQINTLSNTAVVQPAIPEVVNYWGPAGEMGNAIVSGEVTLDNAAEKTEAMNDAMNGVTTITLWSYPIGDWNSEAAISELLTDFREANPDINLQVQFLDYATGSSTVEEAIANGTAPDLILEGPELLVHDYGARGLMADLSDLLDETDISEIYPNALAAGRNADGQLYLYPLAGTVHTMAINKTVFEAAGAMQYLDETSRTWNSTEDFFKAVQAVYEYTGQMVGGVPCESIGGDQASRALVTNLYGGSFTNAEHTAYTWDSEEMVAALQALLDCPGISYRTDLNGAEEISALLDGSLNMAFCWNVNQHISCDGVTADGDEILFMAFPTDTEPQLQSGVWGFGVFDNGSARVEAAKTFVKFMCDSAHTVDAVTATSFFPLRTDAEGTDLSNVWSGDAVRNDYNSLVHMMGDYYQVTTNWRSARNSWISLLQDVANGADIASSAASRAAEATPTSKTEITVLAPYYSDYTTGWWEQFEADYEAAYPDVDLVIECVSWNDIYSRLDEGYTPDILNIDVYAQFVDRLLPVQDYMSDETYSKIYPCFLAESEMDGTIWAVPDLASARGLYYNTEILEAVGMEVPTTWAELEAVCAAIKEYYGDEVIPFGLDMSENEGQLAFALAAWNNGGGFLDENGSWAVNSDANVEAVEFLMHMYSSGYTNDLTQTRYDIMSLFSEGKVAMTIAPSGWAPGSSGIAPIPANEGCTSYSMGVMDRLMCFNNGYPEEELAGITAFFDMFYDDARYAAWVFEEGFLPATSTGMEKLAEDQSFLAAWADILPNCKFYPSDKSGWSTARNGVIGVLGEASNGGDIRTLLDDLQAQLTGGDEEHTPFLSFRWLDNSGEGWFQSEDWKYDGNDWSNGYTHELQIVPGDEFWHVYYLNTWNAETQSYDATPVHVEVSQQLSRELLCEGDHTFAEGAEDTQYYYRMSVLEDTWDQTGTIRYTMDDGTELTLNINICRSEAEFYSSSTPSNESFIRNFYYNQIDTDENVFYFGFESEYWTLESVEPVLGHLGIPDHDASDVFTVEKVNDSVYKITLTPWAVSTGYGIEVGLNVYLTDPEGNSNNGEWYTCIWCHNNGDGDNHDAFFQLNGNEYRFYRNAENETVVYANVFSGEYDNDGNEVWCFQQGALPDGVSYDLDTNTITLNNATLEQMTLTYASEDWQDLPNADLTIELIGENTISCGRDSALLLGDNVNVTITGDGSLALYSENAAQTDDNGNYYSFNTINMWNGANLTIAGNATVTVEIAGEALESCWDGDTYLGTRPAQVVAIEGGMGSLTLKDNASLTTIVPEGSKFNGPKLENEDQVFWDDWYPGGYRGIRSVYTITIEGGTLNTQEIEIPSHWDENGFVGAGSFIQSGGTVNITAHGSYGETEQWVWDEEAQEDVYVGIIDHYHYNGLASHDGGYVEISGGELNIQCLQTEEELASSAWADGIRVGGEGEMIISGGTVNVEINRGYAFNVYNLTVTGGTLNATSHDGSGMEVSNCLLSGGTVNAEGRYNQAAWLYDLTINGGTLNIRNEAGGGIYSNDIKVTDGLLDVQCNDSGCIDVSNSFTVTGGEVNLEGAYGDTLNLTGADATISGGTVTVTGTECQLIGVGGWEETDDGSQDGSLKMTGGKLILNSVSNARGMEIRAFGEASFTGSAQVEMTGGWLDTRGKLDIDDNATLKLTNTLVGVHESGIMTIDDGTITVNNVWNENLEENCIYVERTAQMLVNGGKLTVDAVNFCKGIMTEGTYTQNGGEVTITLTGDRIGYTYHEDTDSYTYFPGFAFSSGGYTTINDGVLNLTGHDAFEQFYSDWDAENPDSRKTKLTVNGGTLNMVAEFAGFDILAPAEFNGGTINVHSTGLYIPFREIGLVNGLLVRHNGYDDPEIASSITINGGNFTLNSDVPGDNFHAYALYTSYAPFIINGGTIHATGNKVMYDISYGPNLVVADHLNIISLTSADSKALLGQYFEESYTDEDGNVVTETLYLGTVEEDEIPCDPFNIEYWDLCTDILITDASCGETTWSMNNGELIISGNGSMDDYTSGDETPWSILRDKITAITVESGVTYVGDHAFAGCTAASTITFLGDAPVIADNAFLDMDATAYYYANAAGWEDNLYTYGGCIYWEAITEDSFRITAQPSDYVGLVGDIATFKVETNGENVSYRWFYSKDGGETWLRLSGTTDTYSLEFLAYRLGYQYRCEVTNTETGAVLISDAASLLAADIPLEILIQPESYVGAVNDSVTFTVEATGNGLTYEWFYSTDGTTWVKSYSPGYQTDMLSPILRTHRDGNMYKCVITDVFGDSVTTDVVSMTVKASDIIIITQPQAVENAILGQLYQFSVEATGDNLAYRWQVSSDGGVTWQDSWNQGYNTATLGVRMNANRDGNMYRCVITSGLKTVAISDAALLDLQDPSVEILSQSGNVTVVANKTATFTVEAEGMDLTYQWYRSNDKGATWNVTYLSGYNTDTLSFVATANRAALYKCKITDGSGKAVWSNDVKLAILSAELKILTQPVSVTCAAGETATFTVEAQGDTLKYQWYASADGGETWTVSYLTGYNTAEFSFVVNASRAAKLYKCVITDVAGNTVETDAVSVTIS